MFWINNLLKDPLITHFHFHQIVMVFYGPQIHIFDFWLEVISHWFHYKHTSVLVTKKNEVCVHNIIEEGLIQLLNSHVTYYILFLNNNLYSTNLNRQSKHSRLDLENIHSTRSSFLSPSHLTHLMI